MHPEFLPTDLDGMLDHVIEEAAEVILAASKIKRFGPDSTWPIGNPSNNLLDLINEAEDLRTAVARYAAAQSTKNLTKEDWQGNL